MSSQPTTKIRVDSTKYLLAARVLVLLTFTVLITRIAWLSDDALITLRTALNLTHGWGPGFNATEAVQGYTHPLWFLMWTFIGVATNQWVLGILLASVALSTAAVGLVLWQTQSIARILLVAGVLIFSNAFMEYSTSGLENPLSYVFVALLFTLTLKPEPSATWALASGATLAGLFLTRMDLALLIAPVALLTAWQLRTNIKIVAVTTIAATVPIAAWFIWSKLTYSAWLPNTLTAKSNLDIGQSDLLVQGFKYFWVSIEHDPVTFLAILTAITTALIFGEKLLRVWALGILIYLAYVWWIGGDFMAGRFLAVPLLVSAAILITIAPEIKIRFNTALLAVLALLTAATALGQIPVTLSNPTVQRWDVGTNLNGNVVDERAFYVQNNRDLNFLLNNVDSPMFNGEFAPVTAADLQIRSLNEINYLTQNWPTKTQPLATPDGVLTECGLLGTIGIAIGPTNHLIDSCALTDRFLAGIPFTPDPQGGWKPGHFERVLPAGYQEAVASNDPSLLKDPATREQLTNLWQRIRP